MVDIQIDTRQLIQIQKTLAHIANGIPKAMVPAINRALEHGRTVVKRQIREVYVIKAKDIPVTLRKASKVQMNGAVNVTQGMLPIDKFEIRPRGIQRRKNKRLIFARVKKGAGGYLQHAFYIPSGGPYARIGPSRFPIFKVATIGAAIMASQPGVGPEVEKQMADTLDKRLDHEVKRVLDQAEGKK